MKTLIESLLDDEEDIVNDESSIEDMLKSIKIQKIGQNSVIWIPFDKEKQDKENIPMYSSPACGMGFFIVQKKHFIGHENEDDKKEFVIGFFLASVLWLASQNRDKFMNRFMCERFKLTPLRPKEDPSNPFNIPIDPKISKLAVKYKDLQSMSKSKLEQYLSRRLIDLYYNKMEVVKDYHRLLKVKDLRYEIYNPIIDEIAEKILR